MDAIRYYVTLILVITMPPAILLWMAIHPFAKFWRKFGPVKTYLILSLPTISLMALLFYNRKPIMQTEYGTNFVLVGIGLVVVVLSGIIAKRRKKYLTFRILTGVPELSKVENRGTILQEGIYGTIRHPRYVEVLLGLLGYALILNYLAAYITFLLSIPALYLVVILEEKELRERFGNEYEIYCQKTPRFIPKF